ncbi:hypothetical protein, partial [Kribbella hippodromi]|uniref:hypothetical protein n=1 Tax=Kribbella hippodromi TaxID=434347 RepID=UPI0031E347C2
MAEDEELAFGRACDVVGEVGCVPSGVVEVAPRGLRFGMLQDLEERSIVRLRREDFESVVHGGDPVSRSLKAGYRAKGLGTVIVEHLFGTAGETHPVAISLSAGALGLPDEIRKSKDRKAADRLAGWATEVLRGLTSRTEAVYGAIAVEETLPTPSALRAGHSIGSLPFLSAVLPVAVLGKFHSAFGRTRPVDWAHGSFFPSGTSFVTGVHLHLIGPLVLPAGVAGDRGLLCGVAGVAKVARNRGVWSGQDLRLVISSVAVGRTLCRSPTTPKS